jgi:hypothetical protein
MRALAGLALIALAPAALNAAPAGAAMTLPVCSGDGVVRIVELPLDDPATPPEPGCVKGCHGGSSRKKAARQI